MSRTLHYQAVSWQHRERSWLEVFRALRLTSGLVVVLFALIAGLAMFNTLAMIVIDKTRDIAILRSIGFTRGDITAIFLWQAALVLGAGLAAGCLLGLGGTWAISVLPVRIRGIFAADTFVVSWSAWHYLQGVTLAAIMVMAASLLPARKAAQLEPSDILRGGAGPMTAEGPTAPDGVPAIRCHNLHRHLGQGEGRVHALRGVSLAVEPGKTCAIVGPSGCGKSTLLFLLGLLDRPEEGEIWLRGRAVAPQTDAERTSARAEHLGFIFQFHFLLPEFTALENVMLPMRKLGRLAPAAREARAAGLLDAVGLGDKAGRLATQLSGGEQQRVAIARALANSPAVILADEPTGNLDARNSEAVFELIAGLARQHRQAVVMVTHNPEMAARCDLARPMRDGQFIG